MKVSYYYIFLITQFQAKKNELYYVFFFIIELYYVLNIKRV